MRLAPVCPQQAEREDIAAVETGGDRALESDSDRGADERRMPVPKPSGDTSATIQDRSAFLQGKIPGATSPKGPFVQARAVFGGGRSRTSRFLSPCPGCTSRIANSLPNKALVRHRVFRGRANRVSLAEQACFGVAFSPKQRAKNVSLARPQPARCGRGHDDSADGGRGYGGHGRLVPTPEACVVIADDTLIRG